MYESSITSRCTAREDHNGSLTRMRVGRSTQCDQTLSYGFLPGVRMLLVAIAAD
jgi:hypothetical protein